MIFNMFDGGGGVDDQIIQDSYAVVAEKGIPVPQDPPAEELPDYIDLIVTGTGSGVVVNDTVDSHGGTIRSITAVTLDGDTVSPKVLKQGFTAHDATGKAIVGTATAADGVGAYFWQGDNYTFVQNVCDKSWKLSATSYNGWTPSTTATTIIASETLSPVIAIDMENYDYYIKWVWEVPVVYVSGTTKAKGYMTYAGGEIYQELYRRRTISASGISATATTALCHTSTAQYLTVYYTSASAATYVASVGYGLYAGATAATFSSATAATPNLTVKTPAFSARCSSTYFATGKASAVDQDATIITLHGELWRCQRGGYLDEVWADIQQRYADTL